MTDTYPVEGVFHLRRFEELTTDELRTLAVASDGGRANWAQWTREMMLAFFLNRHRDGIVPQELSA